jgi:multicomponent K+:H+ antiporter subunit G
MDLIAEILISALLVIGGVFGLVGSYGLLKLDNPMKRLHAPTKASTVGVGTALVASMVYFLVFEGRLSWHELMVTLFLLITSPITANFIAKAYMHRTAAEGELPPTGTGRDWATFDENLEFDEPVLVPAADPDGPKT